MTQTSLENINSRYDAVIIGSGLGGLTAANRLSGAGHRVVLFEHHFQLGGLATWFTRPGGHIFDVSLHGFPYGMVKACRKYWTREIRDAIVQLKSIRFVNPQFEFETTYTREDFTDLMTRRFKIRRSTVDDFFNTVTGMNFFDNNRMTTGELFERFFPGRNDVHRLLMEPITYANGSTLEDLAITYGIVFSNFMDRGVFTFRGGSDRMIRLMTEEIERNGGIVCSNARVEHVEVDAGRVRGVRVKSRGQEKFVEAPCVVSNAGLVNTIFDLVGEDRFAAEWLQEAGRVRVNSSSCQVYIGIREGEIIPRIGDLVFTSKSPVFRTDELFAFDTSSKTFSVYYPGTRPDDPRYRNSYAIVASYNARHDDWDALAPEAYRAEKERLIDRTMQDLEAYIPDIRNKVDHLEAATPKTFKRYTLHRQGSSFGTKFEGLEISRSIFKQIRGLFHTGSVGIIMSGWLGAINYGVIVANDADAFLHEI